MTKVNFAKIQVNMIDGTKQPFDLQHGENGLANQIYMQAREIKWKELGLKMYHADGEVELTDDEVNHIINFIKPWSVVIREAIEQAMKGGEA